MRKDVKAANELTIAFMPAERAQEDAALLASRSLTAALESRQRVRRFRNQGSAALIALARGTQLAIEAHAAMLDAHKAFVGDAQELGLVEHGWGCTSPDCPPPEERPEGGEHEAPLRVVGGTA